jgi:hypothetical protein
MGEMVVECPVEGCSYRGAPSSVEGHISGSTKDGHRGQAGSNFRTEIEAAAEGDGEREAGGAMAATVAPAAGAAGMSLFAGSGGEEEFPVRLVAVVVVLAVVVLLVTGSGGGGEESREKGTEPEGDGLV